MGPSSQAVWNADWMSHITVWPRVKRRTVRVVCVVALADQVYGVKMGDEVSFTAEMGVVVGVEDGGVGIRPKW